MPPTTDRVVNEALEINSQSLDDSNAVCRSDMREFHRVLAEIPNPVFMAIHVALLDWLIAAQRSPIVSCMNI